MAVRAASVLAGAREQPSVDLPDVKAFSPGLLQRETLLRAFETKELSTGTSFGELEVSAVRLRP